MAEISQKKVNTKSILDTFTSLKREIFSYLDQILEIDHNISHTTSSNISNASYDNVIILYEKSLSLTHGALNFYEKNKAVLSKSEEAATILNKLNAIKIQIVDRLKVLQSETTAIDKHEFLKIGNEGKLSNDADIIIIDDDQSVCEKPELNKSNDCVITNEKSPTPFNLNDSKKAIEIIRLENSANMFFIGTDGSVSTPSSPKTISIYSFEQVATSTKEKKINGFIKCGDWMYPLVPNDNPCMKTNFNAYIFPNHDNEMNENIENNTAECSFIGIKVDQTQLMKEQVAFFEDILINFNSLVYQDTTKATDVKVPIVDSNLKSDCIVIDGDEESKINEIESNKKEDSKKVPQAWSADAISDSLTNGAEYLSKGIGTTTEYAAQYIGIGGDKLKSNMVPNSTPAKIDPTLNNVAKNIRYGTHVTVKVSSYLVGKLTSLASYTAKSVAPHIRNGSSQILTKSGFAKNESDASSTLDDVCKVGSSSVKGFVKVYDSLETAAVTLGKNLTEKTVTVVDYKYGTEAAALAENSLYSAGNIAQSVNNAKGLKIRKTFAKATAKEAIYHKHGSENQENTKEIRGSDIYRK